MQSTLSIEIDAPAPLVFELARDLQRWPELLPHYRSVRVLEQRGDRRLVEMAAWRDRIPVRWWAEQILYPDEPRIVFRHLRGPTRGMDVEWSFAPRSDGTYVAIRHELTLGWPLIGELVADRVIGRLFVDNIAGKTLRRIKALAEAGV